MGKKEVLFKLTLLLTLVILTSSVIASATSDVAYIYRKTFQIDQNVINIFTEMGLTTDLIQENKLPDLSKYKFIFTGDERFLKNIPVNNYPSVIESYYHGDDFGLTDAEGVSKLASAAPLSVLKNGQSIQVYTQAHDGGHIALPYYYLDDENVAPSLTQIVGTQETSSGLKYGDVISYANKGVQLLNGKKANEKMCFFGIIESDYWTPGARQLFEILCSLCRCRMRKLLRVSEHNISKNLQKRRPIQYNNCLFL